MQVIRVLSVFSPFSVLFLFVSKQTPKAICDTFAETLQDDKQYNFYCISSN